MIGRDGIRIKFADKVRIFRLMFGFKIQRCGLEVR